ncbi:helix-turn-helix domain-containing protein [Heliobacterium chlorum]|uniref:Helix-turn-helix domain-containing protein n=1 Tax=Heliobacterium chlorum TaxID=2698 RepID=A0ABR7T9K4_HELCL|nr:helix-turn-helix domain-containing protein [Heliobacterium chlorum]MBC9786744.1 helix-turn-helix domain-containing protein [Heliobacterium chlorum]
MTREELRKEWGARVAAYQSSGQSLTEWCVDHDLKPHQLRYWLHKQETATIPAVKPTQWLSVEVDSFSKDDRLGSPIVIKLGKACIEVKPGFDPVLLSQVVETLLVRC